MSDVNPRGLGSHAAANKQVVAIIPSGGSCKGLPGQGIIPIESPVFIKASGFVPGGGAPVEPKPIIIPQPISTK